MADVQNFQMGACDVSFQGVDLGHTDGGTTVTFEYPQTEVFVDKYGQTPVEVVNHGIKVTITAMLHEFTIANANIAVPTSVLAGAGNERITFGTVSGCRLSDFAGELVLHPQKFPDQSFDWTFHKAVVTALGDVVYKVDEKRLLEVTWTALIDETKSDGNLLGILGDPTT